VTTSVRRRTSAAALALWAAFGAAAVAAVPVHTIHTDLKPLIRAASRSPVQFAVLVPHAVSSASGGSWSSANGQATWSYAVQVPTAVSLSFHAMQVSLPADATLVVRGAQTTTTYRASDLHRGELWSRVQPGAGLQFALSVPAAERARVKFRIVSLQAGYRSLGAGVIDHPYYRQLRARTDTTSQDSLCITNYECKVTAANTAAAAATVALLIENQFECSGTLINDVPQDNTPYVLSARHCISGKVGVVDDPTAAAATSVYWDATSTCGATLGSIYDPTTPLQTGAQTVVEQQDAWLIRLDAEPVVSDAQFAGFDASGSAVSGGYTIHHAEGYNKQFVAWFGQAASVQQVTGWPHFLETVNQTGNIGPGASGSALFDQNNHLVGSLTYGRQTSDPSGYGACPSPTPPAPNGTNGAADFTALAAVWTSTIDTTSATGTATIKAALDPQDTGTLVVASAPAIVISFSSSTLTQIYGQPLQLTWSASGATQCVASGGLNGDGWSGTVAAAGSQPVTEQVITNATYLLTCTYPGGRTAKTSVGVNWVGPIPQLSLMANPETLWTTRPTVLTWSSNVTPCMLNGGGVSQSNLPASGSITTAQATSGDVTYLLTCGQAGDTQTVGALVQYVTPALEFESNGPDRRLSQDFFLIWSSYADTCTPSGGAPGDGWSTNSFLAGSQSFQPYVATTGTYTYTLTCSSGPITQQQSTTVTFENNAPYATASLDKSSVAFSASPAQYVTLSYDTNLSSCALTPGSYLQQTGPSTDPLRISDSYYFARGIETLNPPQSGTYTVSVTCSGQLGDGLGVVSLPVTLTVTPPPPPTLSIAFNPSSLVAGETFTASWSSNGAATCNETGGLPNGAWGRASDGAPTGSVTEVASAGQFTFGLTCQSIDPALPAVTTQASLSVAALSETLASSATSVTNGSSFTLTWSSDANSCMASGGGANGSPWSGAQPTAGSVTQQATTNGSFTYTLECAIDHGAAIDQEVTIKVVAPSSGGSGGGGGGTLGVLEVALLLRLIRRRQRVS
jgi:hypothetical protein